MARSQVCHRCRGQLEAGDKFCPHCGAKTGEEFCRMCGGQLKAGDRFCPYCGARVLLIKEVPTPAAVVEPMFEYVDLTQEITLLPGEQLMFPSKPIKIKFHKGNIRTWILDPISGILIWALSAILIFFILDDGLSWWNYGTGEFAEWLNDPNRPYHLFDWPSVFWFVGIGVFILILGWLWSLFSFIRGPPKIDLIATNQRLIFRDEERTGFLTRAMLGVNIFLVLRNPFHIKKVRRTYKDLRHQLETSRDEMGHDYLILTKEDCIKKIKMKKVTFFFQTLVFLVLAVLALLFYATLTLIFLFLSLLSLLLSFYRLIFKGKNPRITFRTNKCQGQLRHFVESTDLDLFRLTDDEEKIIMQTFGR